MLRNESPGAPLPDTPRVRRVLVYDSSLSGHHPDYLHAVLTHCQSQADLECVFMVPAAFIDGLESPDAYGNVSFRSLDAAETAKIAHLDVRARARYELKLISQEILCRAEARETVDECILMYLDYFQPVLASSQGRAFPAAIAGVLFQPYTRVESVATTGGLNLPLLLKAWRKRFRLTQMLRSGKVKRICVPCDELAVKLLNARHHRQARFEMLPEPYFPAIEPGHQLAGQQPSAGGPDIRLRYGLSPDSRVVLVFGRIISRKNVPRLVEAFERLDEATLASTVLLIIGTAEASYQALLERRIEQARNVNQKARIVYDHAFADDILAEAAFAQCDLVAMPYLKAYQSSGILFLAARHRKPVLAANVGLISELVERYDLGLTVNVNDSQAMAAAIQLSSGRQFFTSSSTAFLMRHTAQSHAAVILNSPL